jgi:hypothetical protein
LLVVEAPLVANFVIGANDILAWQQTVSQLAAIRRFRQASFVYVEGIKEKDARLLLPRKGILPLRQRQSYSLTVFSMSPDARPGDRYRIHVDENVLDVHGHLEFDLGYRFDTLRIPIRTGPPPGEPTIVKIQPIAPAFGPEIELQLQIRQSRLLRTVSLASPGVAAATAASAGVLPQTTPAYVRIGLVVVGSAALAIATRRRG